MQLEGSRASLSLFAAALAALALAAGCSDGGPTAASPVDGSSGQRSLALARVSTQEDFNCTNVGQVNVRFGEPGFVNDNVVGLYVNFSEVPDAPMTLQVAWDYENAPDGFETIPLEDEDVTRAGDLLNVEKVIEHTYRDLKGKTKRRVRAELILIDQTGNCARVRDVEVEPPDVCTVRTGGVTLKAIAAWPPGEFLFPFAPGTAVPDGASPSQIRSNPVPGSKPSEWVYKRGKNSMSNAGKGFDIPVSGGSCGLPVLVK